MREGQDLVCPSDMHVIKDMVLQGSLTFSCVPTPSDAAEIAASDLIPGEYEGEKSQASPLFNHRLSLLRSCKAARETQTTAKPRDKAVGLSNTGEAQS